MTATLTLHTSCYNCSFRVHVDGFKLTLLQSKTQTKITEQVQIVLLCLRYLKMLMINLLPTKLSFVLPTSVIMIVYRNVPAVDRIVNTYITFIVIGH